MKRKRHQQILQDRFNLPTPKIPTDTSYTYSSNLLELRLSILQQESLTGLHIANPSFLNLMITQPLPPNSTDVCEVFPSHWFKMENILESSKFYIIITDFWHVSEDFECCTPADQYSLHIYFLPSESSFLILQVFLQIQLC